MSCVMREGRSGDFIERILALARNSKAVFEIFEIWHLAGVLWIPSGYESFPISDLNI